MFVYYVLFALVVDAWLLVVIVCGLLLVVVCRLSVDCSLSVVDSTLFFFFDLLVDVLLVVCCLLFVVCCLLYIVCCLLLEVFLCSMFVVLVFVDWRLAVAVRRALCVARCLRVVAWSLSFVVCFSLLFLDRCSLFLVRGVLRVCLFVVLVARCVNC